jgi:hypothetical protein
MQPAFIEQHDSIDYHSVKRNDDIEDISENINTAVENIKQGIFSFKKDLFYNIVSNDNSHNASDMGSMMSFHALFLQCVGYWIGILDNKPVPKPLFSSEKDRKHFDDLTKAIAVAKVNSSDAKVLVYSMLFQFSTQHPYDLGKQNLNSE